VGRTSNLRRRLEEHAGGGARARLLLDAALPPRSPAESCRRGGDRRDEDRHTKKYMARHGIENVRGGTYCQETLRWWQIRQVSAEVTRAGDGCRACSEAGHSANEYPSKSGGRKMPGEVSDEVGALREVVSSSTSKRPCDCSPS
jgi:hypothetical protein